MKPVDWVRMGSIILLRVFLDGDFLELALGDQVAVQFFNLVGTHFFPQLLKFLGQLSVVRLDPLTLLQTPVSLYLFV